MSNNSDRDQILQQIKQELEHVDHHKIGQDEQFRRVDETNTLNDYVAYITSYIGRAVQKSNRNNREGPYDFEKMMIKAAGLAVAAIERHRKLKQSSNEKK